MIVVLACLAISALATAAYLLSGLDDLYLDSHADRQAQRDARAIDAWRRSRRTAWELEREGRR